MHSNNNKKSSSTCKLFVHGLCQYNSFRWFILEFLYIWAFHWLKYLKEHRSLGHCTKRSICRVALIGLFKNFFSWLISCRININSHYLSINYYMSDTALGVWHELTYFIPIAILWYRCYHPHLRGFPGSTSGKESTCQCWSHKRLDPWVGKIPWRRKWQPTLVFLPGKFHGQRSLVGYSPWGCRELGMTERLRTNIPI